MTTASPAAPDLKAVAASYNDGLRRLVLTVAADPGLQAESSVTQYRQKMASLNDQVEEVRCRSAEIQKAKEEFERLLKELKKRNAEVKTAKSNLEALSQKVGEAAFREFLAGRLTEFPALQTRRDIQQQIDALSKEKVQVDQAAQTGFADKVKTVAHSTTLSGRILLQKQKVASADRSLGSAVLETQQDEQVLATDAIDVLSKVREARKAIADGEENHTLTKRQMDDCRSHAVTLGVVETDSSHFDGEYKKCVERLLDLECKKLSARWEFGQSLLSSPPEALPEHLRQLTVEMSRIASEHPEACNQPPTVIADLKEQVSLLHEKVGTVIFEKGLFKDTLSEEFSKVAAASEQGRIIALRQLGRAAFLNPAVRSALTDPLIQSFLTETKTLALTIKEISGEAVVGTDGKAAPTSLSSTLGGIGCLAAIVLTCIVAVVLPINSYRVWIHRGQELQKQLAEAKQLWKDDKTTESLDKFASFMMADGGRGVGFMTQDERRTFISHVIDRESAHGNTTLAKSMITIALNHDVDLRLKDNMAQHYLGRVKASRPETFKDFGKRREREEKAAAARRNYESQQRESAENAKQAANQAKQAANQAKENRTTKVTSAFSLWDGSHKNLTKRIKDSMNDPDSYKHVETTYNDGGESILVRTKFRCKNGFGGVVTNIVEAQCDIDGNVLSLNVIE